MTMLNISLGQASEAGLKPDNEDHFGAMLPEGSLLENKGLAIAIADGVSGAEGGKQASQMSVRIFLDDYFCTPETWTVKTSVSKVMSSLNNWLYSQSQQYQTTRGMVTTFSAMVIKSQTAYLFHVGDSRIYRLRDDKFEQLTHDHRLHINEDKSYLSRALGIDVNLNIDYQTVNLQQGDIFFLSTDGIHDFLNDNEIRALIIASDVDVDKDADEKHSGDSALQACCEAIIQAALAANSDDNLSCQLLQINTLPRANEAELHEKLAYLPFPPALNRNEIIDGYRILRELHASSRSQVYLAEDTLAQGEGSPRKVAIKTPSVNFEDDASYIDLFLHEEWVGKRVASPYLLKICEPQRKRQFLYSVMEYVQGQTLDQWMHDNPEPPLTLVRDIIEQIAQGLRAMHRLEMIHQDIKPGNIMIDADNDIKIVDFGSVKIAGLAETRPVAEHSQIVGTANYSAPEYFRGDPGSNNSDLYSLGVIAYEMLSGKLPYGEINPLRTKNKKFSYMPLKQINSSVPDWVDMSIKRAVHPSPRNRYQLLSEFIVDLSKPNQALLNQPSRPLIERNPLGTFKLIAAIELIIIVVLLVQIFA